MGKFLPKIRNFRDLSYLSPRFYSHNVKILLKTTNLGIHQRHKISSESLKGPAGNALHRRCMLLNLFIFTEM